MSPIKVVVVTGVSSGIGRATAQRFAERGHKVYGTVRKLEGGAGITGVTLLEMDVRDTASIEAAMQQVVQREQAIDILVNNAGLSLVGAVEETSAAEAQALFEVNVLGLLRASQAVLPQMRKQGAGRIVNLSSVLGFLPAPYMGLYAASKHAVEGLSESMDHETRQFGVRVLLIEPAYTRTSLDLNAPKVHHRIPAYDAQRQAAGAAVAHHVNHAPLPETVAQTIVAAALDPKWRMRTTPKGQASLLSKLRRFMPAGPVDAAIRKDLNLK